MLIVLLYGKIIKKARVFFQGIGICFAYGKAMVKLLLSRNRIGDQQICQTRNESCVGGAGDAAGLIRKKVKLPGVDIPVLPCSMDRTSGAALYLHSRAAAQSANSGVQLLGNGLTGVLGHQKNSLPDIGIATQLGRNAEPKKNAGVVCF